MIRLRDRRWQLGAALVIAAGAGLRLYALDAMEFKGDERESLMHAATLVADHPWSSSNPWPAYGLISSNGVGNAPLFTWIIAALWAPTHHPVGVTALIAVINVVTMYPLWLWARRRMDEFRALMTLAITAFSPFYVLFSRKIWAPDLMLTGLLSVLWGIEWWRSGRQWRALSLFLVAILVVGQLHQSGPIALVLLPIGFVLQWLIDRRQRRAAVSWVRPTRTEIGVIIALCAVNLFFYLPYLDYFFSVPASTFARRQVAETYFPEMLRKVALQIVPTDVFYFIDPDRFPFIYGEWRNRFLNASIYTGTPLLVYGGWRWIRAPHSLPVLGIWWVLIVAVFAAARILTHPYYILILAPITAVLPAGVFDPPMAPAWIVRPLHALRVAYALALLGLSATMVMWLVERGGSAGEYGIAYSIRESQARVLASGVPQSSPAASSELKCRPVPVEVKWLTGWIAPAYPPDSDAMMLCDGWVLEGGDLVYRWQFAPQR